MFKLFVMQSPKCPLSNKHRYPKNKNKYYSKKNEKSETSNFQGFFLLYFFLITIVNNNVNEVLKSEPIVMDVKTNEGSIQKNAKETIKGCFCFLFLISH